ncbi:MAG TPA: purine-nucleoside phosphorylase [Flavobacteriaceae bacterium]|nr:purine-nucleoside phosphorylase [Flavobacteriaceae bacterium]
MSLHLNAKPGDIAETVLLPGDPLRAKWIAETFLENSFCYNEVRGMHGYTGTYKGKRISVQGTGMGIPSAQIYCHELINEYGVKNLIRVGSAGSYQKEVGLRDIVIAMSASTDSAINRSRFGGATYAPTADGELFLKAVEAAKRLDISYKTGNILSSDVFYDDDPKTYEKWAKFGLLCVEMEAAAIYTVAAQHNVKALAVLTISDSLVTKEEISQKDRETSLNQMIELVLEMV